MSFNDLLVRYAALVVKHGLNVQRGQIVNIIGEACHREFANQVAEQSYRVGAGFVNIDLVEPRLHRLRILNSESEWLDYAPPFLGHKYRELVETKAANLRITGAENPQLLSDLDAKRMNRARIAHYNRIKYFYEEGVEKAGVHWCVAAAATAGWALRIFPELNARAAQARLWDEIFKICRVTNDDCLAQWERHNAALHSRARALTELQIRALFFEGPGTKLTVGLSSQALFRGGSEMGPLGVEFEPNIPTEECFTTPDCRITEGIVRATRPFLVNGKLIEGLVLEFKAGEIVEFSARAGKEVFAEYISSDAGAKKLGEVALVGIDSPVYRSGLIFEEILFDENAACHMAIGSAYRSCLRNGAALSDDDLMRLGCNHSSVHTDIMISSEDVSVLAVTYSGSKISLIEGGRWVI